MYNSFCSIITSNLEGSNFSGSLKLFGLWCIFLNKGNTFHPFGIRYPKKHNHKNRIYESNSKKNEKIKYHRSF